MLCQSRATTVGHKMHSGIRLLLNRCAAASSLCGSGLNLKPAAVGSHTKISAVENLLYSASFHTNAAAEAPDVEEASSPRPTPLAKQGPYNSLVKSRGVIRLDGQDVFKFLQGLVTNDVRRLERETPETPIATSSPLPVAVFKPPIYTAILNPQGRFLYDMFLYRPTHAIDCHGAGLGLDKGDAGVPYLLADVDVAVIDELVSYLTKHRLRAKVNVENASSELRVWQRFGSINAREPAVRSGDELCATGGVGRIDESARSTAEGAENGWCWYKDPRLRELGLRGIFPSNRPPPLVTADGAVGEEYYLLWRLEQGVAEGSMEIPKGEAIPLEFNLAGLNAISFQKGCYVGQELVARTHHRGVIRKRLMPIGFVHSDGQDAQQDAVPGVAVLDTASGKKVGKVITVMGSRGLALMRLDAVKEPTQLKLDIPNKTIRLKVTRPRWWPGAWGDEEQQETVANV